MAPGPDPGPYQHHGKGRGNRCDRHVRPELRRRRLRILLPEGRQRTGGQDLPGGKRRLALIGGLPRPVGGAVFRSTGSFSIDKGWPTPEYFRDFHVVCSSRTGCALEALAKKPRLFALANR